MSAELEQIESDLDKPDVVEQLEFTQEAGLLHLKGYSVFDIAQKLDVTPYKAKQYIDDAKKLIEYQINQDPYFLEKFTLNVMESLATLNEISKETWETVEIATEHGMVGARNNALKLALDVEGKKAQMKGTVGGNRADSDFIARMQRAESVNQTLSKVIREVVSECPRCSEMSRMQLAEAFEIMKESDIEDAEVVDA